jgi:hypothetical protein
VKARGMNRGLILGRTAGDDPACGQHRRPFGLECLHFPGIRGHHRDLVAHRTDALAADLVELPLDQRYVGRCGHTHFRDAVEGHDRNRVATADGAAHEVLHRRDERIDAEGRKLEHLDEDHHRAALARLIERLLAECFRGFRRERARGASAILGKVRELLQLAVLVDLEIIARQTAHALAVRVGDDDVDIDDVDLHRLAEGGDLSVQWSGEDQQGGENCGDASGLLDHGEGLQGSGHQRGIICLRRVK